MPPVGATAEEIEMIKTFLLMPLILTAFERDAKLIEQSVRSPGPYIDVIDNAMNQATKTLYEIRREFRERGIKVYQVDRDWEGIRAEYKCRGYTSQIRLLRSLISAEASVQMRSLMGLNIDKYISQGVPERLNSSKHFDTKSGL
ncbi:hypothetical protein M5X00_23215 [Paenibacillus alvei]|uniref:Uncharacterized protein n=2 Tax=Paenibacillus alvei TaxID=44250 RepID=A0ABT4H2H4_PAEAL|nr:hypothetical protein [Paenibacillus alvei]MCY9540570.1 hypothetical protein [Paenibacillus alvei]MCY9737312.1 hypothetical protein [Paenibacillus alvei]MCY9757152.1 hypothetical protein [Paenibacillus alvei]MCY9763144.1 hypothetical protein [Paenibacillus alvei]MCY9770321.1 hypothetical protein [Paenibacillus alvei]